MDWFLYDKNLCHERVFKELLKVSILDRLRDGGDRFLRRIIKIDFSLLQLMRVLGAKYVP